jgi:hypothetical protein
MVMAAHRRGSALAMGLAATLLAGSPASAQETGSTSQQDSMVPGQAASAPWELAVTPYAWATSLHGDIGLGRRTADVDVEFSDLVQDLNGALMLDVELRKGRFALMSDTVYANLEDDGSALDDRVKVKAKMNQLIQTLAGSYRVGKWQLAELGGTVPLAVAVDPYQRVDDLQLPPCGSGWTLRTSIAAVVSVTTTRMKAAVPSVVVRSRSCAERAGRKPLGVPAPTRSRMIRPRL